jgi:hypothetical protein
LFLLLTTALIWQDCRLFIICTSSAKLVLNDLSLSTLFAKILHVNPVMTGDEVYKVLLDVKVFSVDEMQQLETKLCGKQFVTLCFYVLCFPTSDMKLALRI